MTDSTLTVVPEVSASGTAPAAEPPLSTPDTRRPSPPTGRDRENVTTATTTVRVTVTPADVLRHAADYLLEHGWIQDDFYDNGDDGPTPAACMAGAIAIVATGQRLESDDDLNPDNRTSDPLMREAHRLLGTALTRTYGVGVIQFNDHPGQSLAVLVDHMRRVADAWDAHPRPNACAALR
jgi:hypothetical protein